MFSPVVVAPKQRSIAGGLLALGAAASMLGLYQNGKKGKSAYCASALLKISDQSLSLSALAASQPGDYAAVRASIADMLDADPNYDNGSKGPLYENPVLSIRGSKSHSRCS